MRLRILAGMVFLILGLAVYAALVVAIVTRLLPGQTTADLVFYAAAGIAWIWPAARLTRWMNQAAPHHPPSGAST
jgi:membrane protein implicated in regulation of membrane protease activity